MPDRSSIVLQRRKRALSERRARLTGLRFTGLGLGILLSIVLAVLILAGALAYADLTRDLPNVALLPALLNPPGGLLLQPTRLYDRTGTHLLYTFNAPGSPLAESSSTSDLRRYLPLSTASPQHLPTFLPKVTVVLTDPGFWTSGGYTLGGLTDPDAHPTIAQKLVSDLLLYGEKPSLRRALRERMLAAQVTAQYGRSQVLEWYLNSADYGNYAYGIEAAAELYYGKPATDLTTAECAILAATSQSPSLNPHDAFEFSFERGQAALSLMEKYGFMSSPDATAARGQRPAPLDQPALDVRLPLITDLVLHQLGLLYNRERITRGGLVITTTLDYDLEGAVGSQLSAVSQGAIGVPGSAPANSGANASVGGVTVGATAAPGGQTYGSGGVVSLNPGSAAAPQGASSGNQQSAIVLDPQSGQILAADGDPQFLLPHDPGSMLTPFVYLTAFTRGFGPGSMVWDIPPADAASPAGTYHGPVRMRIALANDYRVPAQSIAAQMGTDAISRTEASFGLSDQLSPGTATGANMVSLLDLASAYGIFAANGVRYGAPAPSSTNGPLLQPTSVLRVETPDHSLWLDLSNPQAQPVVTPPLAYLMNSVLSDESARWPTLGHPNELEIGRPVGVKLGASPSDSWAVGYTPSRVVALWQPLASGSSPDSGTRTLITGLSSLLQAATASVPADGWTAPPGVASVDVCDPSGLLPTRDCPSTVTEVFLSGNEPAQPDTLYRSYTVNRETGLLATVFTPPDLVEDKVFMVVPPEAQAWAKTANIPVAPTSFDAIQAPPINPDVHISSPAMFADLHGTVQFRGTASGADFDHYRLLVGQGLNPQEWVQVGSDSSTRIEDGLLGTWDTTGLSGLYAVELQVIRTDQQIDTAIMQVTVK